jgi:choline dehydrogenase-like flavoprotein
VLRGEGLVPTLQARALGGGTVFNSAICMRPAPDALARWGEAFGVPDVSPEALAPHVAWAEAFFGVGPSPVRAMGRRNALFRAGCESLGWRVEALPRLTPDCIGTGQCLTGCRVGGKKSADRRGVPELLAAGGDVYTGVHVDRVVLRGGRAVGVEGAVVDPETGERRATARVLAAHVVLAAGVMATPTLLQRAGVDAPGVGDHLQIHPSSLCVAVFDEDVLPWTGAAQGFHCVQHMDRGIKLEDLWATPAVFASRFPTMGREFARYLGNAKRMGTWATWVTTTASEGRVRALPGGATDFTYTLAPGDLGRLQDGIVHLAELSFAAGASEVLLGLRGFPPSLREDDLPRLREARLGARDLLVASNHVFGTMRMGEATDAYGRVAGLDGVTVVDTSLFPDSPGANPMLLGIALARRNALATA